VPTDRTPPLCLHPAAGPGRRASYSDDDLALGVSFSLLLESHRNLAQLVVAIDDGRERSGVDHLLQRIRSSLLCLTRKIRIFWRTNGDSDSTLS